MDKPTLTQAFNSLQWGHESACEGCDYLIEDSQGVDIVVECDCKHGELDCCTAASIKLDAMLDDWKYDQENGP